jgi:hypothetical protein
MYTLLFCINELEHHCRYRAAACQSFITIVHHGWLLVANVNYSVSIKVLTSTVSDRNPSLEYQEIVHN